MNRTMIIIAGTGQTWRWPVAHAQSMGHVLSSLVAELVLPDTSNSEVGEGRFIRGAQGVLFELRTTVLVIGFVRRAT